MKTDNKWEQFEVQPDSDLYAGVQHRLRIRRAWRRGAVATVIAAAAAAAWMLIPSNDKEVTQPMPVASAVEVQPAATAPDPVAESSELAPLSSSTTRQSTENHPTTTATVATAQPPLASTTSQDGVLDPNPLSLPSQPTPLPLKDLPMGEMVATSEADTTSELPVAANPPSSPTQTSTDTIPNQIWAPNIIVPNGEVDANRYFSLKFSTSVSEFKLYLYNRGGRLIYKTEDPDFRWDARRDGDLVPQGTYVWIATFRDSSGEARREKGTLTVIR
ncbi:MAG: gliding motility-associated C-terminal domain-containing protein [Bacteroidales bacterium]|nr:gliding motility-associated C-terminal domain-containing protein [Bacteroidales bacterium]